MPPQVDMEPQRQPVHADADFAHPDHAFALVVNVPLITMRPENGSTEVSCSIAEICGFSQKLGLARKSRSHKYCRPGGPSWR